MDTIKWGIIGCGDVTERKSGPAFNKVSKSSVVAVMRRDAEKARDYALRHGVPKWYADAGQLINDPDINAIYVATPPSSHEAYTLAALAAGKPVYLEKPMCLDQAGALRIIKAADTHDTRLTVAHYRRALPLYNKVGELLHAGIIGEVRFVNLELYQAPGPANPPFPPLHWRVDPSVSGGGLFHDLAPHQLDLMMYYFGKVNRIAGYSASQANLYKADDIVSGEMVFDNGVVFKGLWCFTVAPENTRDRIEVVGSAGQIIFSLTGTDIILRRNNNQEKFSFTHPENIQQPMIEKVVKFFLAEGPNPCTGAEAAEGMRVIDTFTGKKRGETLDLV